MTRAELNEIKARMLDEIMRQTAEGIERISLCDLLGLQRYTLDLLNQVMSEQSEQAKKAGY